MQYISFTIQNYKGIKYLKLQLDKQPTTNIFTLVGLNESGKTTILEALAWFYEPSSFDPHGLIPKSELLNFNGIIKVESEILLSNEDEEKIKKFLRFYRKFELSKKIEKVTITRMFKYKNSSLSTKGFLWDINIEGKTKRMKQVRKLNSEHEHWQATVNYIRENIQSPIIYYQNFLFNFPDKIYLELKSGEELDNTDKFYKDVIQDVLNSLGKDLNVDSHIVDRYKSGKSFQQSSMESVLNKLSSKIETEVFSTWRGLLKISGTGLSITLGQTVEEDDEGYFIQVKVKEGDQTYFIRERSLGFRWFFSFVLFTRFRAYREKHFKNALFLLDEPASNLHPTAQTKLLSAFGKFPKEQTIVYATHSHHMINPKWLSGTFVVKNSAKEYDDLDVTYNSYMTNIIAERYFKFVANNPNDKDFFKPILDALDFQPSLLELTPKLIITEGKNDFYTIKYMREFIKDCTDISNYVYPGTGKDKIDYIIALYLGWGRNFVVLLDDDSGGRRTYNRIKKDFGKIVDERIFKISNINSSWKGFSLEDIFIENDRLKIIKSIYPQQNTYNKEKFNIALQDAYIQNKKLNLSKLTINRFRKIFLFLEEKLNKS